jgi:replicative DNA helicase
MAEVTSDVSENAVLFFKDVLSKALRDRDFCLKILQGSLKPEHFPRHYMRWTYKSLKAYMDNPKYKGKIPSIKVFKDVLENDDKIEKSIKVVFFDKIKDLFERKLQNEEYSLDVVEDHVRKREFKFLLEDTIQKMGTFKDPNVAINNLVNKSFKISNQNKFHSVSLIDTFKDRHEERIRRISDPKKYKCFKFDLPSLEHCFPGGITAPMFGTIAAKTGRGKSITTVHLGVEALHQGFNVTHITSENEVSQVTGRYDSRMSKIKYNDIKLARLSEDEFNSLDKMYENFKDKYRNSIQIVKVAPNEFNASTILHVLNILEGDGHNTEFLIIDSPDLMQSVANFRDKRLQQSAIYWELKTLLEEKQCIGLATTQLRSSSEDDDPTSEDLSESYDKARLLDFVFVLTQNKTQKATKEATLALVKNRDGDLPTNSITIATHFDRMFFEEKPPEELPPGYDDTKDDKEENSVVAEKAKDDNMASLRGISEADAQPVLKSKKKIVKKKVSKKKFEKPKP